MNDIIYVPLGTTEGLRTARKRLVQELVDNGWRMENTVELVEKMDRSHVIKVVVLSRSTQDKMLYCGAITN